MRRAKAVVAVLAGVGFLVTAILFWGDIDFIAPRALLAGLALLLLGVVYLPPHEVGAFEPAHERELSAPDVNGVRWRLWDPVAPKRRRWPRLPAHP